MRPVTAPISTWRGHKASAEERLDVLLSRPSLVGAPPLAQGGSPVPAHKVKAKAAPPAALSLKGINLEHARAYSPGQLTPSPTTSARAREGQALAVSGQRAAALRYSEPEHHHSVSFSKIDLLRATPPAKSKGNTTPLRSALKRGGSVSSPSSSSSPPPEGFVPGPRREKTVRVDESPVEEAEPWDAAVIDTATIRRLALEHEADIDAYERGKLPSSSKASPQTLVSQSQTRRLRGGERWVWDGVKSKLVYGSEISATSGAAADESLSPSSSWEWKWSPAVSPEGWTYPESKRSPKAEAAVGFMPGYASGGTGVHGSNAQAGAPTTGPPPRAKRPIFTRNVIHPDSSQLDSRQGFNQHRAMTAPLPSRGEGRHGSARDAGSNSNRSLFSGSARRNSIQTATAGSSLYEASSVLIAAEQRTGEAEAVGLSSLHTQSSE